jgi:hypothetical protein
MIIKVDGASDIVGVGSDFQKYHEKDSFLNFECSFLKLALVSKILTNGPFKIALLAVKNQDLYADLKMLNLP